MSAQALKAVVSELYRVPVDSVDESFSLHHPRFRGSAGRGLLAAAIRRRLGVYVARAFTAATYGELESAVCGGEPGSRQGSEPGSQQSSQQSGQQRGQQSGQQSGQQRDAHQSTPGNVPRQRQPVSTPLMRDPAATAESQRVQPLSVGVDIELIDNMPEADDFWTADFYRSHFTPEEIAYCVRQPHPRMHFAARWCAKEALMKCDPVFREVDPTTLQVTVAASGQPVFESLQSDGPRRLPHALSMTHTPQMAAAVVAAAAFPPDLTTT